MARLMRSGLASQTSCEPKRFRVSHANPRFARHESERALPDQTSLWLASCDPVWLRKPHANRNAFAFLMRILASLVVRVGRPCQIRFGCAFFMRTGAGAPYESRPHMVKANRCLLYGHYTVIINILKQSGSAFLLFPQIDYLPLAMLYLLAVFQGGSSDVSV